MDKSLAAQMHVVFFSLVVFLNTGCAYTVFAPPSVLYSNDSTIGIRYRSSGVQSINEPEKAMQLVSDHCEGRYVVINRSNAEGWTTIDARCE